MSSQPLSLIQQQTYSINIPEYGHYIPATQLIGALLRLIQIAVNPFSKS